MKAARAQAHIHNCRAGHRFDSGDPATHYVTAKGHVRYVCPWCSASPDWKLPRGWRKASEAPKEHLPPRAVSTGSYWPF